jgi:hypothetical protein
MDLLSDRPHGIVQGSTVNEVRHQFKATGTDLNHSAKLHLLSTNIQRKATGAVCTLRDAGDDRTK